MKGASSPERVSMMLGLVVLMAAAAPRYLAGGHETRLTLILVALVAVAGVALWHWRQLEGAQRRRLPSLLGRLGVSMLAGLALMSLWHALTSDWFSWQVLLSDGATLGLLLHALWLWIGDGARR